MKIFPLFAFIFFTFLSVPGAFADFDREADEIFQLVNRERAVKKLAALKWDKKLADLAEDYSKQMAEENFFAHTDRKGLGISERAEKKEIKNYLKISENLFLFEGYEGFTYTAVDRWMRSEAHRKNILDQGYNLTGIGIAQNKDGRIYITQIFLLKD